jgi:aryl-alcohol dehydrogenase-like predicted oxidoreductase
MNYKKLGNSDLNVSRICMGCMGFGDPRRGQHSWTIDEEHTREIIKRGLLLGVNFYDTAIAYQSGTSALAAGRLSRKPGEGGTKRAEEDSYAKFKYKATEEQDNVIIGRVAELAEKHGVSMTEVSLAWLLTKVTAPVVGATKLHHIEGAAKAVDLVLTPEELIYLEEPYVPHPLAGVMAQNKPSAAKEKHVWTTGDQKIK